MEVDERCSKFVRRLQCSVVRLVDTARAVVVEDRAALGVHLILIWGRPARPWRRGHERQGGRAAQLPGTMDPTLKRSEADSVAAELEPLSERGQGNEILIGIRELPGARDCSLSEGEVRIHAEHLARASPKRRGHATRARR
jgi:hypothetical protein